MNTETAKRSLAEEARQLIGSTQSQFEFVSKPIIEKYTELSEKIPILFDKNSSRTSVDKLVGELNQLSCAIENIRFDMDSERRNFRAILDHASAEKKKRLIELKENYKSGKLGKAEWAEHQFAQEADMEEISEIRVRHDFLNATIESLDRISQAITNVRISYSSVVKSRNGHSER